MDNSKKGSFFKKGIWIKEQQGHMTIGSLDKNNHDIKVIPDHVKQMIVDMEADMVDALYGESSIPFEPEVVNIDFLFKEIEEKYSDNNLRISLSGTSNNVFKGDYKILFAIIEKMVLSSISDKENESQQPIIYINASLLEDHLCVIYRDSESNCHPSKLKKVILYIQQKLKGEIKFKAVSDEKSYFDILIPSSTS